MKKSVTLLCFALAACQAPVDSKSQSALDATSCPGGKVPFTYIPKVNPRTAQAVSQIGTENGYVSTTPDKKNLMKVTSANCLWGRTQNTFATISWPQGRTQDGVITNHDGGVPITSLMAERCDGKTSCRVENVGTYCKAYAEEAYSGYTIRFEYTCSFKPDVVKVGYQERWVPQPIECLPTEEEVHTACVPENCYGHTRRDRLLDCAPDYVKQVEKLEGVELRLNEVTRPLHPPETLAGSAYVPGATPGLRFDDAQLYQFKGSVTSTGPLKQNVTLWMSSRVPAPKDGPPLDIFRCLVGTIDLGKYTPVDAGGKKRIDFVEEYRIPQSCRDLDPLKNTIRAGWAAAGYDLATLGEAGFPEQVPTTLRASYDLDDKAILEVQGTSIDSTCNTRPLDLFFNHATKVHRAFDYYSQNPLKVIHSGTIPANQNRDRTEMAVSINAGPDTLIGVRQVNVRDLEYLVNKAGRPRGEIAADLTLALSGPGQPAWAKLMLEVGRYRWTDEVFGRMSLSLDAYSGGLVPRPRTGLVPVPDTSVKDANGEVAVDESGVIGLPGAKLNVLVSGVMNESGTTTDLHVPITAAVRTALFTHPTYPLVPGGTRNYVLQVCPTNKLRMFNLETQALQNDFLRSPTDAPPLRIASNGCARSAVFAFRGENVVTPIPEVEVGDGNVTELEPTTSGEDRLSATFDADTDRMCVGSHCTTMVSNGLGGSDNPAKKTVILIENEEDETDTTDTFSTSFNLLGFNVLEAVKDGSIGAVKTTLTISPNYGAIAALFPKPGPFFDIESGRVTVGVSGLSVQFEFKVPLRFGPIQGDLVFGLGAGAGVGVELEHEFNPRVQSSCAVQPAGGGISSEMCPDANLALPAMPFRQARDTCYFMGGTLLEPRDDTQFSAMHAAIAATEEIWVGGQIGNEYKENTNCAASWNSSACAPEHKQFMRWLSDAATFGKATGFGAFVNPSTTTTLGGAAVTATTAAIHTPVDSAVTMRGNNFALQKMSDSFKSVCNRQLVTSGVSHKASITINAGFSAGFSVGFCTPSSDFGICLEGSVNLLEASIKPLIAYQHTTLKDNTGRSRVKSKLELRVDWSVSLLTGALEIKLVLPFFDISYTLLEYEGFKVGEGTLTKWEHAFQKD